MPQENTNYDLRISQLERQVEELSRKKEQQITYPLDEESIKVLENYFLRLVDVYSWDGGVAARNFVSFIATQNNVPALKPTKNNLNTVRGTGLNRFELSQVTLFPVAVDPANDKLTFLDKIDNFDSGNEISFLSEDTPPAGISALGLTNYKINNLAGYTFNITDTSNNQINITDSGVGRLFLQFN